MRIGAHIPGTDPLGEAAARGADAVQIFLSAPQSYKKPAARPDAEQLRAADLPIYVHAPYVMNPASTNPRIRHPSRKTLQQTLDAAAAIGAAGVVVHPGHVQEADEVDAGIDNWRTTVERLECEVPLLIENTAGGDHAMARYFDVLARLWDAVADHADVEIGLCLDTCHAFAAGEDLADAVARLHAITGRIDLVHLNDSKDEAGSARDRHERLGKGTIGEEVLLGVVRDAGCPVVLETPGDADDVAADIDWLRSRLA